MMNKASHRECPKVFWYDSILHAKVCYWFEFLDDDMMWKETELRRVLIMK